MKEIENQKLVKILFACIIAVIIIALIILIILWSNFFSNNSSESDENVVTSKLGEYIPNDYSRENVLTYYLRNVTNLISNAEYKELYSLLSDDYIEYYNLTEDTFKELLQSKKILGYKMTYNNYTYASLSGFNVYSVELISEDKTSSIVLDLIEEKPNHYNITFDGYIMEVDTEYEKINNGLKLGIDKLTYFNDRIVCNTTLTNLNNYNVYVNANNSYENIYFVDSSNNEHITRYTNLSGRMETMQQNSTLSLVLDVQAPYVSYADYNKILLRDIKLSENGVLTDVTFDI